MTDIKKRIVNKGKKFYAEVLKRRNVSDKLPEFKKMRTGTEIFIIEREKRITVYDDYSMYPESSAKSWKVQIYNIEDGHFYDRITMCGGKYPTRERAIAEVERFKSRAETLIFYVFPVGFTYDMGKFIWSEKEEYDYDNPVYATEQEQIEEAEKRIYYITGRTDIDVADFKNRIKDSCSLKALQSFYNAQKSEPVCDYPFWIVNDFQSNKSILYVSANKSKWYAERCGIDFKSRKGYIAAYVYNSSCPELSEYGKIGYQYRYRSIMRTA